MKILKIHTIKCFRLKANVYIEAHELHFMVCNNLHFFLSHIFFLLKVPRRVQPKLAS